MDITAEERERCLKIHLGHRFSRGDTDDSDSSNMSDNGEFDEEYEFWKPDPIPPEVIRRYAISPPLKHSTEVVDKKELVVEESTAEKEILRETQTRYNDMVEKFSINVRGLVDEIRVMSGDTKRISFSFVRKLQKLLKKVEIFEEQIETFQAEAEQLEIPSKKKLNPISKSKILLSKFYAFIVSECLIVEKELKDGDVDSQKSLKNLMESLKKYDLKQKLQLRNSMSWSDLSGQFRLGREVSIRLTNQEILKTFPGTNQDMSKIPKQEEKLESNSKSRRRQRGKNAKPNKLPEVVITASNRNLNQIKTSSLEIKPKELTRVYRDTAPNFGFDIPAEELRKCKFRRGIKQSFYCKIFDVFKNYLSELVEEQKAISEYEIKASFNYIVQLQMFQNSLGTFAFAMNQLEADAKVLETPLMVISEQISKSKVLLSRFRAFIASECLLLDNEIESCNENLRKIHKYFRMKIRKAIKLRKLKLRESVSWEELSGYFNIGEEIPIRLTNDEIKEKFSVCKQESLEGTKSHVVDISGVHEMDNMSEDERKWKNFIVDMFYYFDDIFSTIDVENCLRNDRRIFDTNHKYRKIEEDELEILRSLFDSPQISTGSNCQDQVPLSKLKIGGIKCVPMNGVKDTQGTFAILELCREETGSLQYQYDLESIWNSGTDQVSFSKTEIRDLKSMVTNDTNPINVSNKIGNENRKKKEDLSYTGDKLYQSSGIDINSEMKDTQLTEKTNCGETGSSQHLNDPQRIANRVADKVSPLQTEFGGVKCMQVNDLISKTNEFENIKPKKKRKKSKLKEIDVHTKEKSCLDPPIVLIGKPDCERTEDVGCSNNLERDVISIPNKVSSSQIISNYPFMTKSGSNIISNDDEKGERKEEGPQMKDVGELVGSDIVLQKTEMIQAKNSDIEEAQKIKTDSDTVTKKLKKKKRDKNKSKLKIEELGESNENDRQKIVSTEGSYNVLTKVEKMDGLNHYVSYEPNKSSTQGSENVDLKSPSTNQHSNKFSNDDKKSCGTKESQISDGDSMFAYAKKHGLPSQYALRGTDKHVIENTQSKFLAGLYNTCKPRTCDDHSNTRDVGTTETTTCSHVDFIGNNEEAKFHKKSISKFIGDHEFEPNWNKDVVKDITVSKSTSMNRVDTSSVSENYERGKMPTFVENFYRGKHFLKRLCKLEDHQTSSQMRKGSKIQYNIKTLTEIYTNRKICVKNLTEKYSKNAVLNDENDYVAKIIKRTMYDPELADITTNSILRLINTVNLKVANIINFFHYSMNTLRNPLSKAMLESLRDCLRILNEIHEINIINSLSAHENKLRIKNFHQPLSEVCEAHIITLVLSKCCDILYLLERPLNGMECEISRSELVEIVNIFGSVEEIHDRLEKRNDDLFGDLFLLERNFPLQHLEYDTIDLLTKLASIEAENEHKLKPIKIIISKNAEERNTKYILDYFKPEPNTGWDLSFDPKSVIKLCGLQEIIEANRKSSFLSSLQSFLAEIQNLERTKPYQSNQHTGYIKKNLCILDNIISCHMLRIFIANFYSFILQMYPIFLKRLEVYSGNSYTQQCLNLLQLLVLDCPLEEIYEKISFRNDDVFLRYIVILGQKPIVCTKSSRKILEEFAESFQKPMTCLGILDALEYLCVNRIPKEKLSLRKKGNIQTQFSSTRNIIKTEEILRNHFPLMIPKDCEEKFNLTFENVNGETRYKLIALPHNINFSINLSCFLPMEQIEDFEYIKLKRNCRFFMSKTGSFFITMKLFIDFNEEYAYWYNILNHKKHEYKGIFLNYPKASLQDELHRKYSNEEQLSRFSKKHLFDTNTILHENFDHLCYKKRDVEEFRSVSGLILNIFSKEIDLLMTQNRIDPSEICENFEEYFFCILKKINEIRRSYYQFFVSMMDDTEYTKQDDTVVCLRGKPFTLYEINMFFEEKRGNWQHLSSFDWSQCQLKFLSHFDVLIFESYVPLIYLNYLMLSPLEHSLFIYDSCLKEFRKYPPRNDELKANILRITNVRPERKTHRKPTDRDILCTDCSENLVPRKCGWLDRSVETDFYGNFLNLYFIVLMLVYVLYNNNFFG